MTEETPTLASVARRRGTKGPAYDFDDLAKRYPSLRTLAAPPSKSSDVAWVAAFTHRPEALEGILSDLIKQAYAKPGRIGQRPMPREDQVNLEALLQGEYTDEPLIQILPRMMKVSERAFCQKLNISRRMMQRMLLSDTDPQKYHPDMEMLERIANVVGKPPSYFVEYRLIAAQAAFVNLIQQRPVIATRIYREYLEINHESPFIK